MSKDLNNPRVIPSRAEGSHPCFVLLCIRGFLRTGRNDVRRGDVRGTLSRHPELAEGSHPCFVLLRIRGCFGRLASLTAQHDGITHSSSSRAVSRDLILVSYRFALGDSSSPTPQKVCSTFRGTPTATMPRDDGTILFIRHPELCRGISSLFMPLRQT